MGRIREWRDEIRAMDRRNEETGPVLAAKHIACYRGVTVLRMKLKRSGSVGLIFLDRNADADTLRHEYGHTVQRKRLGLFRYLICIGIPSWRYWGSGPYYDRPWEVTADVFGGVVRRKHSEECVQMGMDYLREIEEKGIRALKGKKGKKAE